jgi:spore maturation protein CgeB
VLDTYYQPFLDEHYAARPELAEASYAEQLEALLARSFGTSDAYTLHLRERGHEAWDVIVNCEPLQLRWAEENGHAHLARAVRSIRRGPARAGARALALRRVLALQIRHLAPDTVYVQDMHWATRADLMLFKRRGRRLVGQIASAAPSVNRLTQYDLVLTSFPHFVERFRALGIDTRFFPIAFDERVVERLRARGIDSEPASERPYAVSFVGALTPASHGRGTALLEQACRELNVDVWGYGASALPPGSPIRARYHGEAWGLDMYAVLARSRIVINRHIDAAEGHANNMRLFEATGAGALLVTDRGSNLAEYFDPGREVVVYDDGRDLVDQLRHYVANPAEAVAIADAGRRRTLAEHTYRRRIGELAQILEERAG